MGGPRFENTLTWNAVAAVAGALLTTGVAYGVLSSGQDAMRRDVDSNRATIMRQEARLDALQEAQQGTVQAIARTEERIIAQGAAIQRIERSQDDLVRWLRTILDSGQVR